MLPSGGPRADRVAAGLLAGVSLWFLGLGGLALYAETRPFGANVGVTGLILVFTAVPGLAIARRLWAHREDVRGLALVGCLLTAGTLTLVVAQGLGPQPVRGETDRFDQLANLWLAAAAAGAVVPLLLASVALGIAIRRARRSAYFV